MIRKLTDAPAGLALTARVVDGDEILIGPDGVTVAPILDGDGEPLDGYTAEFTDPGGYPFAVEWLQDGVRVGYDIVESGTLAAAGIDEPYFTVAEARALKPLNDTAAYTDAAIEAMRVTVEQAIERRAGVAFVPRTITEVIDGNGSTDLLLRPRPIAVTAATVDGTARAGTVLYPTGIAYNAAGWTTGRGNVAITYTHGHETVPGEIKQAALRLTRDWLVEGPIDERVTTVSTDDGAFAMATPGLSGTATGLRSVDAAIALYALNVAVA